MGGLLLISGEFKYTDRIRPPVTKKNDKPLMGLQSNKNFIVLNAIDNILAGIFINYHLIKVPRPSKKEIDYLRKPDFGKEPEYLRNIK